MEYLYNRKAQLEAQLKKLEKDVFKKEARTTILLLRARLDEICQAIRQLEHEN